MNVNDSENTPMAAFKSPSTENPAANFTKKGINFSTFPLLKISIHVCLKDIFVQECSSRLSDLKKQKQKTHNALSFPS